MGKFVKRTFLLLLCALFWIPFQATGSFSQAERPTRVVPVKSNASQCAATISESPRLRGFYLNQTAEEVSSVLPSFREAYEAAQGQLLPQRDLVSDFREVKSEGLEADLTQFEDYRDASFVWQFLNGRVVQLQVTYEEYEPENLSTFLEAFTSTSGLPLKFFRITGKHTAVLTCVGFSVEIREGSYTKTQWVPSKSQITLTDTEAFAAMDVEEKEVKMRRAKEEALKKAESEKKKRTFKP